MNKRTFRIILIVFILVVIIASILFYFLIFNRETTPQNDTLTRPNTFFPVTTTFDENGDPIPEDSNNQNFNNNDSVDNTFVPRLRQISAVPTAGGVVFERETTSTEFFIDEEGEENQDTFTETIYRYIERGTGHVFETTGRTLAQVRLSNVTIPKINDAKFDSSGNNLIFRYLNDDQETIETFVGGIVEDLATSTSGQLEPITKLEGQYLENNIYDYTVFGNSINYLIKNGTNALVKSLTFSNLSSEQEFSLPTSEWILQKPNSGTITMTTKADSRVPGFMFSYNLNSGTLTQLLEDINGLTTLTNQEGNLVLISRSRGNELNTFVYNTDTRQFKRLNIDTLPEKCVWSNSEEGVVYCGVPDFLIRATYPESWYQGKISFNDSLWKVDVINDDYDNILSAQSETEDQFDVINPMLSPSEDYLIFINKNDLTLWSLDLEV